MESLAELVQNLHEATSKYTVAHRQLNRLEVLHQQTRVRLSRAEKGKNRGLRYNLHMRMVVIQGVRSCYKDYCNKLVKKIALLDHRCKAAEMLHVTLEEAQ